MPQVDQKLLNPYGPPSSLLVLTIVRGAYVVHLRVLAFCSMCDVSYDIRYWYLFMYNGVQYYSVSLNSNTTGATSGA